MEWIGCARCDKFRRNFVFQTCALMAHVRLVLQRLLWSNETVRNAPKHEFWVERIGSGAFVAKNSDAASFSELVC
jgi:hypothetical protein